MNIKHPTVRVGYELQEIGHPTLQDVIGDALARLAKSREPRAASKKKPAAKASRKGIRKAAKRSR
jgi:hypothetical protein